jgi:TolB protein
MRAFSLSLICLLGGALLAAACAGEEDGDAAGTPAAAAARTAAPPPAETCDPGLGPPQEGLGPPGLPGQILFVRLVFGCQPDVWIMNAGGSGARPLTDHPAIDDEADLSPDGTKAVFFSGREGNSFIYVMDVDGSILTRLTNDPGGDVSPRWSPDGSQIAFSRSGSLYVMNADGSGPRLIMEAQAASSAEPCRAGAFVGSWSPDGERITYYSAIVRPAGENTFWICAIGKDGSNLEVLVSEPEGKLHAEPYWSPDGRYIAFRSDRDGDCSRPGPACTYEIYVLDLETGEERNVTNSPGSLDIEPAWSPDSEWIIFASNRDDPNFDLYIIRPDGTGLHRLLDDPGAKNSYPSWR